MILNADDNGGKNKKIITEYFHLVRTVERTTQVYLGT